MILALSDNFIVDTGAFNPLGLVIPYNTLAHLMGPYRVPSFGGDRHVRHHHEGADGPVPRRRPARGRVRRRTCADRAAEELGIDPVDLRARNLLRPDELPFEVGILYRDGEPLVLTAATIHRRSPE
jgi:carbon-monoxide dehydrogenase large subunit